jgi:hypothetical protein
MSKRVRCSSRCASTSLLFLAQLLQPLAQLLLDLSMASSSVSRGVT